MCVISRGVGSGKLIAAKSQGQIMLTEFCWLVLCDCLRVCWLQKLRKYHYFDKCLVQTMFNVYNGNYMSQPPLLIYFVELIG